ncbi:MAG: hypothetical protein HY645_00045 [Acidobacteria bacterium]|nr:hypothetical protein [Acidobacteriota bacterium]
MRSEDQVFEARVESLREGPSGPEACISVRGARWYVSLSLLDSVQAGDYVLVQGKVALGVLHPPYRIDHEIP